MENQRKREIWIGIGLLFLCHAIAAMLCFWVFNQPFFFFLIGITQLVYAIPLSFVGIKWPGALAGVWIGVGVTFLLNAIGCGISISKMLG